MDLVGNTALIALSISTLLLIILLVVSIKTKKKKQVNYCFMAFTSCLLISSFINLIGLPKLTKQVNFKRKSTVSLRVTYMAC